MEFSTYATPDHRRRDQAALPGQGLGGPGAAPAAGAAASLATATTELTQKLGRSPTVAELAAHLGISEEEVLEGLESANAYTAVSLEAGDGEGGLSVAETLGAEDAGPRGRGVPRVAQAAAGRSCRRGSSRS